MPTFPATAPTSGGGQISLAQIEQNTAPRLGPYARRAQSSATAATATNAYFDELKSAASIGGVEGMFMLRRGQKSDGTTVAIAAGDRQRIAGAADPLSGAVPPDRLWTTAPTALEYVEFHHLDPALELRVAVQNGLRRCFFEDRISVTLSNTATERDLTTLIPWLVRPDQLRRVQFTTTGATLLPADEEWHEPFEQGGHVWLAGWPDQFPNILLITANRPYWSRVNGADSSTGPVADEDLLDVDIEYASSAAHIEAWKLFPAKLKSAADGGFQATQQQAASEFTRVSISQRRRRRRTWALSGPFGDDMFSRSTR